ncbi:MAG TPA: SpoIIE family protein phosphatase [Thermoanaerobaculia bacterium]|nr:SpoIIE family protein phosphatase [Thermoanaerobaculia bacterium]
MRIRTQLILAAFVLAVVPLAAIVTYSYHSSRRALEAAYRNEAQRLTQQMDRRLAMIRTDLEQRLRFVSALPLPNQGSGDAGNIISVMGETASLVDALDFEPLRAGLQNVNADVETDADADETDDEREIAETPEPATVAAVAPVPPMPPIVPVVIDLPPVPEFPRFVMSEEQKELLNEIGNLGGQLHNPNLTADERADIREELKTAQEELRRVTEADRAQFQMQMRQAQDARRHRQRAEREMRKAEKQLVAALAPPAAPAPAPVAATTTAAEKKKTTPKKSTKVVVRSATTKEIQNAAANAKKTALLLGRSFEAPVRQEGEVVGQLTARISPEQVIRRILGSAADDRSEIPFAIDREGTLYTRTSEERSRLEAMEVPERVRRGRSLKQIDGWIVSTSVDPQSGLRIGVARPVGDNLQDLRNAAARNFGIGLGLIAFALIGIVPLSNHLARDVKLVTEGAERIAHGDLMTRLPVKTKNEFGQLARAFNRMAEDLSVHQQKLLEQERARKEQELQQALMSVEYERKSVELEDARRFQLSMLPKEVPHHPAYDVAVFTRTATEVGGDYYDFHVSGDSLSVTIGDATGHGAKAGTMVTVIKTLFAGYGGASSPAEFLADAAEKIKRMDLGRMAMALSLGRFDRGKLTIASAGMPPVLVHRASSGDVDEIALQATPLGTFGSDYPEASVTVDSGDTVLFLTDGFPELMNDASQQLGYTGALEAFAFAAKAGNASDVIAALGDVAKKWHGDAPPNDDVTFVVVRVA